MQLKGTPVSVLQSLETWIETLPEPTPDVRLLIETAKALALEVDVAGIPDDNGRTKSAASAVRELRAVVEEITTKGRRAADDDDDNWFFSVADLAEVRDAAKRKPGNPRPRSSRGGAATG